MKQRYDLIYKYVYFYRFNYVETYFESNQLPFCEPIQSVTDWRAKKSLQQSHFLSYPDVLKARPKGGKRQSNLIVGEELARFDLQIRLFFFMNFLSSMVFYIFRKRFNNRQFCVVKIMFDTIAAIATPPGEGGIAIIRISGSQAIHIVDKIYKGNLKLSTVDSHTIHYGHIVNNVGEVIDEVMVTVMKSPRTFTREDVVEVNCHGGLVSVQRVLEEVLCAGARLAEPGEFTKRAFLNGRIDLSQAEAVIDLIRAKTDRAMKVAMGQVQGKLSGGIEKIRNELLQLIAHIEVNIDYPEHDVEEVTRSLIIEKGDWIKDEITLLLRNSHQGKIMREGLSTAIVGRPNVGKSSLLNTLIQESKAIVTDIPGTTRDIIEEYVNVRGIPLRLIDTAGIRHTEDVVEKIGVKKSREVLDQADLILLLLNNAEPLTEEDMELLETIRNRKGIIVINKMDLPQKLDMTQLNNVAEEFPLVTMSIKNEKGIEVLEEAIAKLFFEGQLQSDDLTYVSNARHIQLLKEAKGSIEEASESCDHGLPVDMIAFDLRRCWELLGEITGETVSEDLLDQIFSRFCLGK